MPSAAQLRQLALPRRSAARQRVRVVGGFPAGNYLSLPAGGGLIGTSGGQLGYLTLFRLLSYPVSPAQSNQLLRSNINGSNSSGWQQVLAPASGTTPAYLTSNFGTGTGFSVGPNLPLLPADVGRIHAFCTRITATPSGVLDSFLDTMQAPSVAQSAYAPPSGTTGEFLGIDAAGTLPGTTLEFLAWLSFTGTPTAAQILAYLQAARTLGDLPTSFTGATITQRWSMRDALGGAYAMATDGQTAPAVNDTVTGLSTNRFSVTGAPTVREYGATDSTKTFGLNGASSTSYYKTANPGGLGATSGPFSYAVHLRPSGKSLQGFTQVLAARSNGSNAGHVLSVVSAGGAGAYGQLQLTVYESGGAKTAAYPFALADLGRDLVFTVHYTATAGGGIQIYREGALVAATPLTAANSMVPYAGAMTFGALDGGGSPMARDLDLFGLTGKDALTTQSEINAHVRASRASGKMVRYLGATRHWDFGADIAIAGPDAGLPSTVSERVSGTDNLTLSAAGASVARKTERTFGYDAAQVTAGFLPNASGTYYESSASGHDGGALSGKSVGLLFRVESQQVNKPRDLLSLGTTTAQKIVIRASGPMSLITAYWVGSATVSAPTVTLTAADVGRLLLLVTQWDPSGGGTARMWHKRAELLSPGSAMANYQPGTGNSIRLGQASISSAPAFYSEECTVLGCMTFDGVWTPNEIGLLYDGIAAEEDLVPLAASRMGHWWSLKRAIAGGSALPASVADLAGGGSPLAQVGAPTFKAHYAYGTKWT